MIEEAQNYNDQVKVICQLPQTINVYDMCFDWSGKKLAVACNDKKIRIYEKKTTDQWVEWKTVIVQGAAIWKVKWARPQFGVILLGCSRDSNIKIFQFKRKDWNDPKKIEWNQKSIKKETNKCIQDLKFLPSNSTELTIGYVCGNDPYLKLLIANDSKKISSWNSDKKIQISELGLNCLSWSKDIVKNYFLIAIGCKSDQTTPKKLLQGLKLSNDMEPHKIEPINTVAFVSYRGKQLEKVQCQSLKETKAINDISWALVNGRSYSLLGIASDSFAKVYEINVKQNGSSIVMDVLAQFSLGEEERICYRLTFNVVGTMVAVAEKKKIGLFKAFERSSWGQIKTLQDVQK